MFSLLIGLREGLSALGGGTRRAPECALRIHASFPLRPSAHPPPSSRLPSMFSRAYQSIHLPSLPRNSPEPYLPPPPLPSAPNIARSPLTAPRAVCLLLLGLETGFGGPVGGAERR